LLSLSKIGGFNFIYVNPRVRAADQFQDETFATDQKDKNPLVTASFKNESFGRALNSVLVSAGLQAKLEGRTLLVGEALQDSRFGTQMSKIFRLNQTSPETASDYLASLGARMSKVIQEATTTGQAASAGTAELSSEVSQTTSIRSEIDTTQASEGPLLGLVGTIDPRLGTVTLVGEPRLIAIAESYLKQIDLRKRQVALKVQLISIKLDNDRSIDSSFSSRMGDAFIVSDSGKGHINFGKYKPGNTQGGGIYGQGVSGVPGTYSRYGEEPQQRVVDPTIRQEIVREFVDDRGQDALISLDPDQPVYAYDAQGRPIYLPDTDPSSTQELQPVYDKKGRLKYVKPSSRYRQANNSFYSYLEAQIQSKSAKVLAEPTLLVGEGQTSAIKTGLEVVTNVTPSANGNTYSYKKDTAGLTLTVGVDRIDDNGFITMNIVPKLAFPVPAGSRDGIPFFNIDVRELLAKGIRLRDRQTLIVSGVISESHSEEIKKWPILGDLPVIGSLFRASQSARDKEELVVVVTPQVLDDQEGGVFGYGYQPGTSDVRKALSSYP